MAGWSRHRECPKNYAGVRRASWPWGLTTDSNSGKYGVYLRQSDNRDYWLYTGQGSIVRPPSSYFDDRLRIEKHGSSSYCMSASVKVDGCVDLYIWWYDEQGKPGDRHIGRYFLPEDYKTLIKEFELPEEAKELSIAFLLGEKNKKISSLYIDDL